MGEGVARYVTTTLVALSQPWNEKCFFCSKCNGCSADSGDGNGLSELGTLRMEDSNSRPEGNDLSSLIYAHAYIRSYIHTWMHSIDIESQKHRYIAKLA